jgi:adenylate cyclase
LSGSDAEDDFPVLEEIRDTGTTDYIAIGLSRRDGRVYRTSWTTARAGGFTDAEIERLLALRPALGVIIELQSR